MNWLQAAAQISVERIVNALPEGCLIAIFAWVLLRMLRQQNAGTRFAVWFLALMSIVSLPLIGGQHLEPAKLLPFHASAAFTVPAQWAMFVFLAWIGGVFLTMTRLAGGFWHLHQLRRSCVEVAGADLSPLLKSTIAALQAQKTDGSNVVLATSPDVRVPTAIGFRKRMIVLPAWTLQELPAEDLNVILLHEFAHLERRDDWTNLAQKIVRALFFFHPAVWWIEKQLSVEREMACDDAVLAKTSNPHGYASCLVSLLEKSLAHRAAPKWSVVHAAVNRAREVSLRLAQILSSKRPAGTGVWKPAVAMTIGFGVVCLLALPLSPRFVAFDRGNSSSEFSLAQNSASSQPLPQGVQVIPAGLHTSTPLMATHNLIRTHKSQAHAVTGNRILASALSQRATHQEMQTARVVRASAKASGRNVEPQYQTLVFVEATQLANNGEEPVWRMQVWRVTMMTFVLEKRDTVPAANSI